MLGRSARSHKTAGFSSSFQNGASNLFAPKAENFMRNQKRLLNLHEHDSQNIMRKANIATPNGVVATSSSEAKDALGKLGVSNAVVKAQILAGGRGRGKFNTGYEGGVHVAKSPEEAENIAKQMLGNKLITKQSGAEGKPVNKVLIQEMVNPKRELYFAILLDRSSSGPVMVGSTRGGMSIEDVAKESPEEIHKIPIDINEGIKPEQANDMAKKLGFEGSMVEQAAEQIRRLYNLFVETDSTQIEINPLLETTDGKVVCADAKLNFDDNAGYRHKDIFELRDLTQEDPREVHASKYDLNYIGLDGNIGCIVNGAGLAMATMDIIKHHGGNPANFLDVGGGASEEQVREALKILNSDKNVRSILINIFGGIMRCDNFAQGIVNAANEIKLDIPLVVRLEGTMVDKGRQIFKDSDLHILNAQDLDDAAYKAVSMADIIKMAKNINVKVNFEPEN
eukprot:gb/GECH01012619.1/.p1 GENE.gb/GECH01012619.1/~~gb/GECH01012619.1/.p1  ORF type:complete len:452 (+),score=108.32 gb/GECH01012619.1/:1-1356(+)